MKKKSQQSQHHQGKSIPPSGSHQAPSPLRNPLDATADSWRFLTSPRCAPTRHETGFPLEARGAFWPWVWDLWTVQSGCIKTMPTLSPLRFGIICSSLSWVGSGDQGKQDREKHGTGAVVDPTALLHWPDSGTTNTRRCLILRLLTGSS